MNPGSLRIFHVRKEERYGTVFHSRIQKPQQQTNRRHDSRLFQALPVRIFQVVDDAGDSLPTYQYPAMLPPHRRRR